jgi:hypothetical protein
MGLDAKIRALNYHTQTKPPADDPVSRGKE